MKSTATPSDPAPASLETQRPSAPAISGWTRGSARIGGVLVAALLAASCSGEAPPPAASTPAAPASSASAPAGAAAPTSPASPTSAEAPAPAAPPVPALPPGKYTAAQDGGQSVVLGDVRIETTADLPEYKRSDQVVVSGDNQVVFVLRGWPIVVHEGRLAIAGHDFGAAPAGSVIRLSKDGVHVDAEHRGPLP